MRILVDARSVLRGRYSLNFLFELLRCTRSDSIMMKQTVAYPFSEELPSTASEYSALEIVAFVHLVNFQIPITYTWNPSQFIHHTKEAGSRLNNNDYQILIRLDD